MKRDPSVGEQRGAPGDDQIAAGDAKTASGVGDVATAADEGVVGSGGADAAQK
ncbi:hypothetical protein V7S43_012128 [Phytophthora oleae]|uniref:Uncharacterized protein n=1 Tax=Phytophthora oleae TaxID=2107226 RepID=A0ABD3FB44_9STRA